MDSEMKDGNLQERVLDQYFKVSPQVIEVHTTIWELWIYQKKYRLFNWVWKINSSFFIHLFAFLACYTYSLSSSDSFLHIL
jgi:hypothetical protein